MTFTRFIETVGITALAACLLLGAQASASTEQQACVSGWEDSSARDYCPNATIGWFVKNNIGSCTVDVTCSVTVRTGEKEEVISGTVSAETSSARGLKLCLRSATDTNGNSIWKLVMADWCGSATDAATAVAEGLPAQ